MLAKPRFFESPSEARVAVKKALNEGRAACSVNDVFTRVDPDEGKWFGVIVLDTDSLPTLLRARRQFPEFRVIGELLPEAHLNSQVHDRQRRLGNLGSSARCP